MIIVVLSQQLRMPFWYYRKNPIRYNKSIYMEQNYVDF